MCGLNCSYRNDSFQHALRYGIWSRTGGESGVRLGNTRLISSYRRSCFSGLRAIVWRKNVRVLLVCKEKKNTTIAHKNVFTFKTVCLFSMERITSTRIQLLCIRPVECNIYIVTLGVRTSIALNQSATKIPISINNEWINKSAQIDQRRIIAYYLRCYLVVGYGNIWCRWQSSQGYWRRISVMSMNNPIINYAQRRKTLFRRCRL